MKSYLLAAVFVLSFLTVVHAQQSADEKYLAIYDLIQQAGHNDTANPQQTLATLKDVHAQLETFQRAYPDWNPAIISYRLEDLSKRIAALQARVLATTVPEPVPATNVVVPVPAPSAEVSAQEQSLRAQLRSMQAENQNLQAKLKEALSAQPAAVDSGELARSQEVIRSLMKQNDLLKASGSAEKNPEAVAALRKQLADLQAKYTAEQTRAEKLVAENTGLQQDLKQAGKHAPEASTALDVLRNENDRLKAQLAALQATTKQAAAAEDQTARLKAANAQIATLQSTVAKITAERDQLADERDALDKKTRQLSAKTDESTAKYEARIRELTAERDDLTKELAATKKKLRKGGDTPAPAPVAPSQEVETLRARLAVDEAQPLPYTPEELALFRQTAPAPQMDPVTVKHSISELPSGSAELVASAQRHFSNHEFDAAETDYQKILDHDQNNGLALANLATIELQENKLADAEKHITAAIAQSPNDAYNLSTLGYLKFLQGKYDEALDVLSRAAKLDPNNPEVQNYLGVTLSHKGLRQQAETALRKAIEINPLYAPAHNNLAVVYLNQTPASPFLARWHYQKAVAAGQPRNLDLEKMLAAKGAPVDVQ